MVFVAAKKFLDPLSKNLSHRDSRNERDKDLSEIENYITERAERKKQNVLSLVSCVVTCDSCL